MSVESESAKYELDKWQTLFANTPNLILLISVIYTINIWADSINRIISPDLLLVANIVFIIGTMKLIFWAGGNPHLCYKWRRLK